MARPPKTDAAPCAAIARRMRSSSSVGPRHSGTGHVVQSAGVTSGFGGKHAPTSRPMGSVRSASALPTAFVPVKTTKRFSV